MAYNYAREKRKFDGEWKRKALWYRKEGMSEEDIEAMYLSLIHISLWIIMKLSYETGNIPVS